MRLFSAVALVLLLPAITACSGMPGTTPDGPAPLFHTNINEEGSKRFTFEAAPSTSCRVGCRRMTVG